MIVGDAFARPLVDALDELDGAVDLVGARGDPLGRRDPLADGEDAISPSGCPGVDDHRRLRLVGGRRPGPVGHGRRAPSRATARASASTTRRRCSPTDFAPAPAGVVGKLARRGHIPLGYYKDPEKTAATFPVVDGVRWSVPGDDARIEDDGTITLLGRGSVSINTGGEKVYPEEVESALKSDPDVMDAIVVGVPDAAVGRARRRAGRAPRRAHGRRRRARPERPHPRRRVQGPRDILVVDAIVRSPSGKPDYRWGKATAISRLGR